MDVYPVAGKVALPLGRRQGLRTRTSGRGANPDLLEPPEGEQPVLAHRASQRKAGLVAFETVRLVGEEVGGVEVGIPDKLEDVPVNLVAARLGHDVNCAG